MVRADIDFQGSGDALSEGARLLGGSCQIATMDDHTPNTGVATFQDSDGLTVIAEDGQWHTENLGIGTLSNVAFTIGGLSSVRDDGRMKLSVSIRASERLHDPGGLIPYTDRMLTEDPTFEVQGLSVEELAAEKPIAWALKALHKHYVDLVVLAHRYPTLQQDLVADLVDQKVRKERGAEGSRQLYANAGVRRTSDIAVRIRSPQLAGAMHARNYDAVVGTEVVLTEEDDRQLPVLDDANLLRRSFEQFWAPVLDDLARL